MKRLVCHLVSLVLGVIVLSSCRLNDNSLHGTLGEEGSTSPEPACCEVPQAKHISLKVASQSTTTLSVSDTIGPYTFVHQSGSGTLGANGVFTAPSSSALTQTDTISVVDGNSTVHTIILMTSAAGSADEDFGAGDIVIDGVNYYSSLTGQIRDTHWGSDGYIYMSVNDGADKYLARINSMGEFDTSYGTGGRLLTAFEGTIAEDSSGNLILAKGNQVQRYLGKSSFDTSFGAAGTATLCGGCEIYQVAVDGNNKIKLSGNYFVSGSFNYGLMLAQLDNSGSLDPTFNGGAIFQSNRSSYIDAFTDIAVDAANNFVLSGVQNYVGSPTTAIIARYTSSGGADGGFAGTGEIVSNISGSSGNFAGDVEIDGNGKIVVVTTYLTNIYVSRFNVDGTPDTSFSGDGKASVSIPGGNFWTNGNGDSLLIDSQNRIIFSGRQTNNPDIITLVRFKSDGDIDTSFGVNGVVELTPRAGASSSKSFVLLGEDDSILHLWYSNAGGGYEISVTKFWP